MKNLTNNLIVTVFLLLLFTNCEKQLFDYRNKYVGDYNFVTISVYFSDREGVSNTDTTYYLGDIYYDKDINENEIYIHYKPNVKKTVQIDESGEISGTELSGNFKDEDELSFDYRWGGLAAGGRVNVSGTKN